MTDTGRIPGEGQPEYAGAQSGHAPAAPAGPSTYPYSESYADMAEPVAGPHAPAEPASEEEDLLMPGAQGAWTEGQAGAQQPWRPQPQSPQQPQAQPDSPHFGERPEQQPLPQPEGEHRAPAGANGAQHAGGPAHAARVNGAQGGGVATQLRSEAPPPAPAARRPLHLGPPVPEQSGMVRPLSDRGPAQPPAAVPAPAQEPASGTDSAVASAPAPAPADNGASGDPPSAAGRPVEPVEPSHGGPEYLDVPQHEPALPDPEMLPGPQLGALPPESGAWPAPGQQPEPDPEPEPVTESDVPSEPEAQQPVDEQSAPPAREAPAQEDAPGEAVGQEVPVEEARIEEATAAPAASGEHAPAVGAVPEELPVEAGPVSAPQAAADATAQDRPEGLPQESADPPEGQDPHPQESADAQEQHLPATGRQPAPEAPEAPEAAAVPEAPAAEPAPPAEDIPAAAPAEGGGASEAGAPADSDASAQPADSAGSADSSGGNGAAAVPAQDAAVPPQSGAALAAAEAAGEELPQPGEAAAQDGSQAAGTPAQHPAEPVAEPVPEAGTAPRGDAPATPLPEAEAELPPAPEAEHRPDAEPDTAPGADADTTAPDGSASAAVAGAEEAASAGVSNGAPAALVGALPEAALPPEAVAREGEEPMEDESDRGAPADAEQADASSISRDGAALDALPSPETDTDAARGDADTAVETADSVAPSPGADADAESAAGEEPSPAAESAPQSDADQEDAEAGPEAGPGAGTEAGLETEAGPDTATGSEEEPEAGPGAESDADPATEPGAEGAAEGTAEEAEEDEPRVPVGPPAAGFADDEREAVHRLMRERRDIRKGFRPDPIPHEVLLRVLEAAHTAPSVGHSQPWDFVVIRSEETRRTMHQLAQRQREAYAKSLPKARAKQFKELKVEAILDTPVNIVVTADSTRGGRHTLGRHTQPQMAPYSSALAVENLWLAARAEGLGVGWVSFFDEREMVRALELPEHLEVVAYLCVGYVDEFPPEPELMQAGWSKRRPLSWVVHEESYGRRVLPGAEPHDLLAETVSAIRPLDAKALGEAWERQKRMTKPAGALGMLEIISAQLCGLSRKCPPPLAEPAAVAVFAGDHGVHAQGVTPWPQEVTGQMVANFLGGGAVCNAFANQVGAEVCVVDVGVASELPAMPGLLPRKVRAGTNDMTSGPALTTKEALRGIEVGIETARDLVAAGNKALLTGEMGIANTTASAALISACAGTDPAQVTGRGTGINDETHARKVEVVRRALELHQPDPADPIGLLAAVGGLEHAALVGLILGAASLRTPVILDGVSAGAAALVARCIAPEALAACIAGHRSAEPGHVAALKKLGLRPLVDLDLRLGEGTGALLALPMVQSAARAMHEVATFDAAGVTDKG